MNSSRRHSHAVAMAVVVLGLCFLLTGSTQADTYLWYMATGGVWSANNWSNQTTGTFPAGTYPQLAADIANVINNQPSTWPSIVNTFAIDVAGISVDTLNIEDNVLSSAVRLDVNQNATIMNLNSKQDGSARNVINIAASRTLTVNKINFTGDYHSSVGGSGTLSWTPVSNAATFNYWGFNDNNRLDMHQNFADPGLTTMVFHRNGGVANLESLNATWTVGNASGTQLWVAENGGLVLQSRSNGTFVKYLKPNANDVDMGKRTTGTVSEGFAIYRGNLNNPVNGIGRLFTATDSDTSVSGGNASIANYRWRMTHNNFATSSPGASHRDVLGANLTITDGGSFTMTDAGSAANYDDVNSFWVLPGQTLKVDGSPGTIRIEDTVGTSPGRMGIYFSNATVNARGNLELIGSQTFLNDGGGASTLLAGGNVQVQSQNPTGYASLTGLPAGQTAAFDDFNLMATTLTMDGGGSRTLAWETGASTGGSLDAGDFSQTNFTVDTLKLTSSTLVSYSTSSVMFLDGDFVIDPGSVFAFTYGGGAVYLLDPDLSEQARIQGYLGTGLLNAKVTAIPGVGLEIVSVPEPAVTVLLALGGLIALAYRRR